MYIRHDRAFSFVFTFIYVYLYICIYYKARLVWKFFGTLKFLLTELSYLLAKYFIKVIYGQTYISTYALLCMYV